MILAAPSGPITATSEFGQAYTKSAPIDLLFKATYAPPKALRVITVILGTVASEYAYKILAPWRIIPPCSCVTPGKNPVTSSKVMREILKESQKRINRAILSLESISRLPAKYFGWLQTSPTVCPLIFAKPTTTFLANAA